MVEPSQDTPESNPEAKPSEVKDRVSELELQLKEKENKFLYLYAEFENYKKRAAREREDFARYAWEPLAKELLQALDNLERALAHASPENYQALVDGLAFVLKQVLTAFGKHGLEPIDTTGKSFDPLFHEGVGTEPSELAEGTVTREESRGYMLHGRLLRPARVFLSRGPGH